MASFRETEHSRLHVSGYIGNLIPEGECLSVDVAILLRRQVVALTPKGIVGVVSENGI